jgi:hypothetical protein
LQYPPFSLDMMPPIIQAGVMADDHAQTYSAVARGRSRCLVGWYLRSLCLAAKSNLRAALFGSLSDC